MNEIILPDFQKSSSRGIYYCMEFVFLIIIFIFSVMVHEISHGAMANFLGDPTAKNEGRLTLNPIRHIDPIGSIFLPLILFLLSNITGSGFIFGWAKPVPVNPFNFRDKKYGELKVAFAGPGSNLAIAVFFGLILRFVPIPAVFAGLSLMLGYIVYINVMLAIFNLIPIPPLDGSHILFAFLPRSAENIKITLSQFGFPILLVLILFFSSILVFIVNFIFAIIVGAPFI